MPGPLPKPAGARRRRNPPTIPTTVLPIAGFSGEIPDPPYALGDSGRAFWDWAWRTPQASAWDPGSLYALARRAYLEDEVAALGGASYESVVELIGEKIDDDELVRRIAFVIELLQRRAGNVSAVFREMRELDKRFGLDPKGVAEHRWSFAGDKAAEPRSAAKVNRTASPLRPVAVDPAG